MNYLRPERLDALARDYATGVLVGAAKRRFERLLREHRSAELAVARWRDRLGALDAGVMPVEPRGAVWQGLEQRLFPSRAPATGRWWQALVSGRGLGGALAGAALCAVLLTSQPGLVGLEPSSGDGLPASYVGLLHDAAGKPTLLASSRRHGRVLTVKLLQPISVPAGQVAQLWALPADGSAAFPVGVVPTGAPKATVNLSAASEALFFKVNRLGVSFEAAPAVAGAQPSGPFVLQGDCVKLW